MSKPENITVVRGAIFADDGTILTIKRAKGKNPKTSLLWEIPGGQVDPQDTLFTGIIDDMALARAFHREIGEETGLDVEIIDGFESYITYPILDGELAGAQYEAFYCRAIVKGGTLRLKADEHTADAFRDLSDIPGGLHFTDNSLRALGALSAHLLQYAS